MTSDAKGKYGGLGDIFGGVKGQNEIWVIALVVFVDEGNIFGADPPCIVCLPLAKCGNNRIPQVTTRRGRWHRRSPLGCRCMFLGRQPNERLRSLIEGQAEPGCKEQALFHPPLVHWTSMSCYCEVHWRLLGPSSGLYSPAQ